MWQLYKRQLALQPLRSSLPMDHAHLKHAAALYKKQVEIQPIIVIVLTVASSGRCSPVPIANVAYTKTDLF